MFVTEKVVPSDKVPVILNAAAVEDPTKPVVVGGLSNLLDRVVHGQVVDYLDFKLIDLWVNLGDVYITLGVLIIMWDTFKLKSGHGNNL